ncbi:MAG: hypothetical protein GW917_00990 [Bdellovibrionales bacterium]|nr:hypothetical protein [Bdellovibrionales bacterium]
MHIQLIRDSINNQRGQGVTEYILVLVVIVAMLLGGMYQLNTAFQKWANNYFGDYLACLLETGELPSIGGAPGDSGICNELFQPFDFTSGRTPRETGDGGDESNSGEDESLSERSRRGSGKGGGGTRESATNSRGSYVSGSSSGGRSSSSRQGSAGGGSSGKAEKKYTGSTDASNYSGLGRSQTNSANGRPRYVPIISRRIVDTTEEERTSAARQNAVSRNPSGSETKRIQVVRKSLKKDTPDEDEPMTFGGFLRFLIIAAIIIALVLFLGGQALQISKNSE